MPPKLESRNLSREADGERIVDGVSLSVEEGDVLGVVGPSGAGKSSFLRLLNRLDEPTGGTVFLDGADYRTIPPRELRRRVGYVPQRPALRGGTVRENVTVGPRLRGESVDEADVARVLGRVGLRGYEDRTTDDLSGGEAQRVAIARTILNDPEALLLDEPTASLDAASEAKVESLLEELVGESNTTAVLVTHDRSQAGRLADRVAVFADGRVETVGPTKGILS
ncbi:ABC transporter ATP-binding protein [Halopelagius longus]|uniref:Phosphate ABC transporter ATP-binding protein n=1 Tax=Halopelagius longus TaxID=1236180 RepID=A0A1H0YPS9_9EURY|nr:phosphate ABC transporter ATP-binding protein [Halopelagius longus]RDI72615.1 phosphate ABC transporter ATP-binding protein [Halopelagius longus]SDQ17237.1 putative ABC transport system ATP-binding protein [Halopelagius longus]